MTDVVVDEKLVSDGLALLLDSLPLEDFARKLEQCFRDCHARPYSGGARHVTLKIGFDVDVEKDTLKLSINPWADLGMKVPGFSISGSKDVGALGAHAPDLAGGQMVLFGGGYDFERVVEGIEAMRMRLKAEPVTVSYGKDL